MDNQETQIHKIVAGMFGVASGSDLLAIMNNFAAANGNQAFAVRLATFLPEATVEERVDSLMANFGFENDDTDPESPGSLAHTYFHNALDGGANVGNVVYAAVQFLSSETLADDFPAFVPWANLLANKALLAEIYSANFGSTTLEEMAVPFSGEIPTDSLLTNEEAVALLESVGISIPVDIDFTFAADSTSVIEGGVITYTVTASQPVEEDTEVVFTIVPDDSTAADQGTSSTNLNDFNSGSLNPATVVIAAGETTATFQFTAKNEGLTETIENFSVTATVAGETFTETTQLLDGAAAVSLTVDGDEPGGTSGSDVYSALPAQNGAGALIDTLQDIDTIDGGDGTDTLNATISGAPDGTIAPTLTSVEHVNIRFTGGAALDLIGSTGVTNVGSNQSTAAGSFDNLGSVGNLSVSNQSIGVTFNGSTASSLTLTIDTVGASAATTVDLNDATATSLMLNLHNNDGDLVTLSQAAGTATSLSASLMGDNVIDFSAVDDAATSFDVDGNGSLTADATSSTFAALTDLNVSGDAAVDLSGILIGTLETVAAGGTTGGVGVQVDDTATSITTGSGDDNVIQTAALAANATVDLGGGDDNYTIGAATDDATASVEGGEGEDTLSATAAVLATPVANPEIYTGFDVLAVTDVIPDATSIDLSDFEGIDSFKASQGVAAAGTGTVTGVGNGASVTMAGDLATNTGALVVTMADASGADDSLNFVIDTQITENSDATVDTTAATATTTISGVETLNVESTGTPDNDPAGSEVDIANNTLALTNDDLVTLNISGDQMLVFASAATMEDLAAINAGDNTAGVNIDVSAAPGTAAAITITGSQGDDTLLGSDNADTISGGDGADTITGGGEADTLSGGAGNDIFAMLLDSDSTLVKLDKISDFSANTVGQGTDGAADENGATATVDDRDGDVIDISALDLGARGIIEFSVQADSADALTFLNNASADLGLDAINIAFVSSTGRIFIDANNDGTADSVVELTGVTTLDEAAFVVV